MSTGEYDVSKCLGLEYPPQGAHPFLALFLYAALRELVTSSVGRLGTVWYYPVCAFHQRSYG